MQISYIWDEQLVKESDRLPAVPGRATMVHNLIHAYKIFENIKVVKSKAASFDEMKTFHSDLYLNYLMKIKHIDSEYIPDNVDEEYGIGYDCPPVSDLYNLVSTIAGGSITAAKCLILGISDVSINWFGGWHHANRFGAEGFCYINDVVIAIEKLKSKYPKVLYIDLDIHHGNGVQDAYSLSKSVFTFSIHKYEPGFYPGSGGLHDIGSLSGKGYACNIPLLAYYSDETFVYVFERVFSKVIKLFCPDAIVVQCGADALSHDPNGGACLTEKGYCKCIQMVLDQKKPTMILGGGGYNFTNTARLWTIITAMIANRKLEENIPDHCHWTSYGPNYTLSIDKSLIKDSNQKYYIDESLKTIEEILERYLNCEEPDSKKLKFEIEPKKTLNFRSTRRKCTVLDDSKTVNIVQNKGEKRKTDIYEFDE